MAVLLAVLLQAYDPDPDGSLEGWKPAARLLLFAAAPVVALLVILFIRSKRGNKPLDLPLPKNRE